jgi:hypothetical protein
MISHENTQRETFLATYARAEVHNHGAAAFRSLLEFLEKRLSQREFDAWARYADFVCVGFAGVLYIVGAGRSRKAWGRVVEWVSGPGELLGFASVEAVAFDGAMNRAAVKHQQRERGEHANFLPT